MIPDIASALAARLKFTWAVLRAFRYMGERAVYTSLLTEMYCRS